MSLSTPLADRQAKPASPFTTSPFLRGLLLADAVTSAAAGLLMVAGADMMMMSFGIPAVILHYAGLALFPFAAFVLYLATRKRLTRGAVWAVVACNLVWVVESILLLVSGWIAPTALGTGFVIVQAVAVAIFAELQIIALMRAKRAS